MIKLSAAALSYAQRPGFKALLFSDVKAPAEGAQSAACSEAAADLTKMGLTVLPHHIFYGKAIGRRSERTAHNDGGSGESRRRGRPLAPLHCKWAAA